MISDVVSDFIIITRLGKDSDQGKVASKQLDHYIDDITQPLVAPFIKMSELEGAPHMSSFRNVTPWVSQAQDYVSGHPENKEIKYIDEYKTFTAISGEFSHAKPKIQYEDDSTDVVDVLSYSHSAYNWRTDSHIDAADFYAAEEVGAKFKSREAVNIFFDNHDNETEVTCQEIN